MPPAQATDIDPVSLYALNFSQGDLSLALHRTHSIQVSGSGQWDGDEYTGTLTYQIGETYGFGEQNAQQSELFKLMRFLQTTCGAPQYPDGAQHYELDITVKKDFELHDSLYPDRFATSGS